MEFSELCWREVVVRAAVDHTRQTSIGQHADRNRTMLREMTQVLLHFGGACRAVDADNSRLHRQEGAQRGADFGAHQHASGRFHRDLHLDGHLTAHGLHGPPATLHR